MKVFLFLYADFGKRIGRPIFIARQHTDARYW